MNPETENTPKIHGENGKSQNRIKHLFGSTVTKTKDTAKEVGLVIKELAMAPARVAGTVALSFAADGVSWWHTKVPSTLVGVPLGLGLATMGLTPLLTPMAMATRGVLSAENMLGSVIAGAIGCLAGSALVVWFWEGAVIYTLLETLFFVSRVADETLNDERRRDLALAQAA